MSRVLVVGVGGFIGAAFRYVLSDLSAKALGDSFPYGTLFVNALGGLFMGFLMQASVTVWPLSPTVKLFLTTGILGGFTTFSTFSHETMNMLSCGNYIMGSVNAGLNLSLSLFFVWLGKIVVSFMG